MIPSPAQVSPTPFSSCQVIKIQRNPPNPPAKLSQETRPKSKVTVCPPIRPTIEQTEIPTNFLLNGRFQIEKKIGGGSYGEVYQAIDHSDGSGVAVKFSVVSPHTQSLDQIAQERKVYKALDGVEGIPKLKWSGLSFCHNIPRRALVLELQGVSLEALSQYFGKFSLSTVLMLGIQILNRLEELHARNYVHRDIKPDNFVMGLPKANAPNEAAKVYMVDFGLAKAYTDGKENHIPEKPCGYLVGTVRYASVNSHLGMELSRRDDLESLGYMLIYFLKGRLPWQGIHETDRIAREKQCGAMKQSITLEELCSRLPTVFLDYIQYCRNLGFSELPDYLKLKKMFYSLHCLCYQGSTEMRFDWHRPEMLARVGHGQSKTS